MDEKLQKSHSDMQSFEDSFDRILGPSPTGVKKKKRLRVDGLDEVELDLGEDEHEADTKSSTYRPMKMMAKRIKLLDTELRIMTETKLKMQSNMEDLIKKVVRKVSRPVKKETDKFLKGNNVLN